MTGSGYGFDRECRMLRKADFQRVFREGRRGSVHGLRVIVAPSPTGRSRLGMAVSRRFGIAVARNRARRLLREAFRHEHADWPAALDVVALPQQGFPDRLAEVRPSLKQAVGRAARPRRPENPSR